ncbi:chemotaxis protein CheW [uncultured Desulfobacter sp.]|uniref:chemotaxis protein CheW n=1 Tax=uncultured Desulfobacter sp. TaxID=240139 RepID=UPI002AABFBA6|nr:chemotaxis protein CheW [uncultured Desulfobacter sp.]
MEKTFMNNNSSVQVNRRILETLISLAGELVLGRNQLIQGISTADMGVIETSGQSIDLITSEIQDAIMQTRMQSVNTLLKKICQKFGDRVVLDKTGKDVALDRSILESIQESLDALVDTLMTPSFLNGKQIEKSNTNVLLKTFQDAGQVNILISSHGISLSPTDIPAKITSCIEEVGGALEVDTMEDKGCAVLIRLPLTLEIIPIQIICVGEETFAVPQANLSELLRISAEDTKNKIAKVGDTDVVSLRGELMPLLNLSELLKIEKSYVCPESGERNPDRRKNLADRRCSKYRADGSIIDVEKTDELQERDKTDRRRSRFGVLNIAIVFAGNYKYGLVVDRFYDSEEIVVKSVGRHLKRYKAYAGATVMGDGRVCLILDILNLAQLSGLSVTSESGQVSANLKQQGVVEGVKESIVMFKNAETEYFAACFEHVVRIERFETKNIERIKNQKVIQYRGKVLELYDIAQIADVQTLPEKEFREVIVFEVNQRQFGLMVSPPVDILEVNFDVDQSSFKKPGIKGTMTVKGHTTLIIDIPEAAQLL